MTKPAIGPLCISCRHIRADYACDAFPDGIPFEIVAGNPHREPFKGDGGIRYEKRPDNVPAPAFESLYLEEGPKPF